MSCRDPLPLSVRGTHSTKITYGYWYPGARSLKSPGLGGQLQLGRSCFARVILDETIVKSMSDIESSSDFRQIHSPVFDIFDEAFWPFFAHNLESQAFSPNFKRRICVFITNTFVFQTLYPLPSWQISNGGESFSPWFRRLFFGFPAPAGSTSPAGNRFRGAPAASRAAQNAEVRKGAGLFLRIFAKSEKRVDSIPATHFRIRATRNPRT